MFRTTEITMKIERREFIGIAAAAVAGFSASGNTSAQRKALDLTEKSVGELQSLMQSRAATSVAITSGYLTRIRSLDKKLNSIIELNPDALAIAAEMDKER